MMKKLTSLCNLLFISLVHASSFPDYHHGRVFTFLNSTMNEKTPIKIIGKNAEYNKEESDRDNFLTGLLSDETTPTLPLSYYNPTNQPPVNVSGKTYHASLINGIISYMEVIDEYNYNDDKTIPVQLSTSWYTVDNDKSDPEHTPGLLEEAIRNGHLLNVTLKVQWEAFTANESYYKNLRREWEIEEHLCYYDGTSAQINAFGKCVIPYTEIIDHYKRLWNANLIPVSINGVRTASTNELSFVQDYTCGIIREDNPAIDRECANSSWLEVKYVNSKSQILTEHRIKDLKRKWWFEYDSIPSGIGWAVNTTFGYNRFKKVYDVNFTVLFNNWTFDLPHGMLNNYRDESFRYDLFRLDVYYWIADPIPKVEREMPASFVIMAIIIIFPVVSLVAAVMLFICTRSRLGFNKNIWNYKNEREEVLRKVNKGKKMREKQRDVHVREQTMRYLEQDGIDIEKI